MNKLESVNAHESGTSPAHLAVANEIDLYEIIAIFKRYRWLMIGVVFFVSLATVSFALLLPKVYRAEVVITPPSIKDVEQLNIFDMETSKKENDFGNYFYVIQEENLYDKFIRFLSSKQLQHNFFKENNLLDYWKDEGDNEVNFLEVFHKKFSDKIAIDDLRYQNKNELETVVITLEGGDEKLIVEWLNKYVVYVDKYTIESIINGITTKAQLQIEGISRQINSLRDVEKSRRLDLIEQYKEAVLVADSLGMTDQVSISFVPYSKLAKKMDITLDPGDSPLYLRGSKALQAGLSVLQQRKNDDPFISNLRNLQQRMKYLSHLDVEKAGINAASIDQFAFVSGESVKPNRKLIIVIGFLLGCLMALFAVLIKNWQTSANEKVKNTDRSLQA
ncbi:hypothetical protein JYT85_02175 [Desulfocapsa sp. AH-315-G09]|nr:hypothetical protein [Desulfocapsa sp.]MBN4063959.1 hypothetical protein [bacterium AH-315-I07]MBN4065435.1 hypothetical protein [Desulfocapsa sp. AH-315-G09]